MDNLSPELSIKDFTSSTSSTAASKCRIFISMGFLFKSTLCKDSTTNCTILFVFWRLNYELWHSSGSNVPTILTAQIPSQYILWFTNLRTVWHKTFRRVCGLQWISPPVKRGGSIATSCLHWDYLVNCQNESHTNCRGLSYLVALAPAMTILEVV